MTDITGAGLRREGDLSFMSEDTGETTPAGSPPENDNQEEETQSPEGENTQDEPKPTPFHEHPDWKAREEVWNKRFNDLETRHQRELTEAITSIRDTFDTQRKQNAEQTQIPAWFGGDQAQWDAYRADRDAELKQAEQRAYERLKAESSETQKATEEATNWLNDEVAAIEQDSTLNPTGTKVDPQKLFETAYQNQLVDTKGRWNYRAAWRIMQAQAPAAPAAPKPKPNQVKKQDAAATTSEQRAEPTPSAYKSSEDFKKPGARPW